MASLDHRLNPLFSIKECMSCGALYTRNYGCARGSLEDKILVSKPSQDCGNPVDGLYCRSYAFMRRCLNEAQEDLMEAIQAFLKEYDHIPPNEKCMALLLAEERFLKIKQNMREKHNQPQVIQELFLKLMDDLQTLKGSQQEKKETTAQSLIPYWNSSMIDDEEARDNFLKDRKLLDGTSNIDRGYSSNLMSKLLPLLKKLRNKSLKSFQNIINCPSWNHPLFYFDDDDDDYIVIWRRPKAITPDEPSEEPEDPLIMGEKKLSTIPKKDKSSVENLVPIPSGFKGVSDDIYDNDYSDAKSLLSQDIPITSPKIDFLYEEFAGEFVPIPPGMDEDEFDEEEFCYNTTE
ncbi:hypothetical protein Tco_1458634 [Tanacetum coccineum]